MHDFFIFYDIINIGDFMKMKRDLHIHTDTNDNTDGQQSPLYAIYHAWISGTNIISITDHNTSEAYGELEIQFADVLENAKRTKNYKGIKTLLKMSKEMKIIQGIELDVTYIGRKLEILAYGIDSELMEEEIKKLLEGKKGKTEVLKPGLLEALSKTDYDFNMDVLDEPGPVGERFFKELSRHPKNKIFTDKFKSYRDFIFKGIYNPNSEFFVDYTAASPSIEDAIKAIKKVSGEDVIISLAHPDRYKEYIDLNSEIDGIILVGINALEIEHPINSLKTKMLLNQKVKEYGLNITGGSDDHNANNPKKRVKDDKKRTIRFEPRNAPEQFSQTWYRNNLHRVGISQVSEFGTEWVDKMIADRKDFFSTSAKIQNVISEMERMLIEQEYEI